jgi:hypothetical protein
MNITDAIRQAIDAGWRDIKVDAGDPLDATGFELAMISRLTGSRPPTGSR